MGILPRYVLLEVIKMFLIAVTAMTMMVVIGFVGKEAAAQGLPLGPTLRLIPYFLPETLRITVPMTLLLACTTVFSRVSGSNEIVAVKAMGISPMVLLWPVLIFAFLMSLVSVWLNDIAVSWGRKNITQVVVEAVEEIAYSMLQSQKRYSTTSFSINVKSVEGRRLQRVTVSIQSHGTSPRLTITAEEAELRCDPAQGVLKVFLRHGEIDMGGRLRVEFPDVHEQEIPLIEASRAHNSGGIPTTLPLRDLPDAIVKAQTDIDLHEQTMAAQAAYQLTCGDFSDLGSIQWQVAENDHGELGTRLLKLQAEPHRRWSGGFACLCFAMVGAPMAIRLRNGEFLTNFFLCFLPILIVYYPLLIYGADGAKNGTIPTVAIWAGNFLLMLWGFWLLRRVIRY